MLVAANLGTFSMENCVTNNGHYLTDSTQNNEA